MSLVRDEDLEEEGAFRSNPVCSVQIVVPRDALHHAMDELGSLGVCEVENLNPGVPITQLPFHRDVRHASDVLRSVLTLRKECAKMGIVIVPPDEDLLEGMLDVGALKDRLAELSEDVFSSVRDQLKIEQKKQELEEESAMLRQAKGLLEGDNEIAVALTARDDDHHDQHDHLELQPLELSRVSVMSGVVPVASRDQFQTVVFRLMRGNCVVRVVDLEEAGKREDEEPRCGVFVAYRGQASKERLELVAKLFNVRVFNIPMGRDDQEERLASVEERLDDTCAVLRSAKSALSDLLASMAPSLGLWEIKLKRELSVLEQLNKVPVRPNDATQTFHVWCPVFAVDFVAQSMRKACAQAGVDLEPIVTRLPSTPPIPTYFAPSVYTAVFHGIVEAYGVPRYGEFTPTLLYTITFPFLFGVMFGDVGHGLVLLGVSAVLVADEERLRRRNNGELLQLIFNGRHLLVLMGLFSIYVGMLYNETFSMAFDVFGSSYNARSQHPECGSGGPMEGKSCVPYPFGLDPVWKKSTNELEFVNSLKMKLAILLGTVHMTGGILISALNAVHFHDSIELYFVFVPRLVFFLSMFGYLAVLIVVKWLTAFGATSCAPSILATMVNMFIKGGVVEPVDAKCEERCKDELPWEDCERQCTGCDGTLVPHQQLLQQCLLAAVGVTVVWLLFVPPLLRLRQHKRRAAERNSMSFLMLGDNVEEEESDHYEFSEDVVHNMIHTFEFVLGGLSNTASYLRLWALSLAHSQLSTIFWEKLVVDQLNEGSWLAVFIGTTVWMGVTAFVLLVLESLSAFLHALRLHWVEFQNKFFHGDGRKLQAFDFETIEMEADAAQPKDE